VVWERDDERRTFGGDLEATGAVNGVPLSTISLYSVK
jgi:hypothetical protein